MYKGSLVSSADKFTHSVVQRVDVGCVVGFHTESKLGRVGLGVELEHLGALVGGGAGTCVSGSVSAWWRPKLDCLHFVLTLWIVSVGPWTHLLLQHISPHTPEIRDVTL